MATGNFVLDKGYDAAAALTIYRAVKFSAEETVTPVTGIADVACGVAQFGVTAPEITKGKGASVRVAGISEMEASAAITVGALVAITANGRAAAASTGARIIGVCTQGAGAAGERCSVALVIGGALSP
jgi:hypothetical protein